MTSAIPPLTLVSHALCPYVQRVAIVLREKGMAFERRDIDLADKPAWFLAVSPLGKTPVLLVGDTPVFESAVICDFLEELQPVPPQHPQDPLHRAQHRGWVAVASAVLDTIAAVYNAPDAAALSAKRQALRQHFERVEAALGDGPHFAGQAFSVVDAAFAPVFRYLDAFDRIDGVDGLLQGLPKVTAWRAVLQDRASVREAAAADYPQRLLGFLRARGGELARRLAMG